MGIGSTFGTDSGVESTIALLEARLPAAQERRRQLEEELAAVIAQEDAMNSVLAGLRALSGSPLDGQNEPRDAAQLPVAAAVEAAGQETTPPSGGRANAVDGPADASPTSLEPAAKPARKATGRSTATRAPAKKTTARKAVAAKSVAPEPEQGATVAPLSTAKKTAKSARKAVPRATEPKAAKRTVSSARKTAPKQGVAADGQAPATAATTPGRRRLADADSVLAVLSQATDPLRAREVTELLGLDTVDANINAIRTRLERLAKSGQAQRPGRGLYRVAGGVG